MEKLNNLEDVLDRIAQAEAGDGDHTSIRAVVTALGRRSFAPLLILPGLVTLLPIGGIPGVPTVMGVLILLVSVQLLFGQRSFWLPGWLLDRSVARNRLETSRHWMRRPVSAVGAGVALTLLGLALLAHDGLVALLGIIVTISTLWAVFSGVIGS